MGAPFEIVAGPIQAWIAPLGTAFPDVEEAPAVEWLLLGANGDKNIAESGMTIRNSAEVNLVHALGTSMAVKAFRGNEAKEVEFDLMDWRLETISYAMGGPATAASNVTDTPAGAGTAGYRSLSLLHNFVIPTVAMLVRTGINPYGDDFNSQFEYPKVVIPGDGVEFVFTKSDPVLTHIRAIALYDANIRARFQDAVPA